MSQTQPPSLDQLIERFKRELTEHAALERARVTAEAEAAITRIHDAGASLSGVPRSGEELRSPRRFERSVDPPPAEDVPAGALLMARRLADEGHTREEVTEFLADNFRRIDVPTAVGHAFQDASAAS